MRSAEEEEVLYLFIIKINFLEIKKEKRFSGEIRFSFFFLNVIVKCFQIFLPFAVVIN